METEAFDWGHGFIPRVGPRNFLQVDRSLSPPNLLGEPVDLPLAIVDLHWALTKPHLISHLRQTGTKLIFDSQGWRYREDSTFGIPKFVSLPYASKEPIEGAGTTLRDFVRADIAAQARLGADFYLIPGFVPKDHKDDVGPMSLASIDHAIAALSGVPAKPLIAFVGGHTKNLSGVERVVSQMHGAVSGIYLQLTPIRPMKDSPAKLVDVARLLLGCRDHGIKVIGGRLSAAGTLLRSVGIDAVDGGLAEGETFALKEAVAFRSSSTQESKGARRGPRIYVQQLGTSMNVADYLKLVAFHKIAVHLTHSGPCCRFKPMNEIGRFAGEHSLRCRVEEVHELSQLPAGMRPRRALDLLRAKSSTLTTVNGILMAEGQAPFQLVTSTTFVRHSSACSTNLPRHSLILEAARSERPGRTKTSTAPTSAASARHCGPLPTSCGPTQRWRPANTGGRSSG